MAVKVGVAAKLMAGVSPADIERAKQRAHAVYAEAYTPIHPVKTASGTVLMCWFGRVDNAFEALAGAQGERRTVIQAAVDDLCARSQAAINEAEGAASDYIAKCLAANVKAEAISVPGCECPGCLSASQRMRRAVAVQGVRTALFALVLPKEAGTQEPALLGLSDEATAIRALKEAMQGLIEVSEETINWTEVWA